MSSAARGRDVEHGDLLHQWRLFAEHHHDHAIDSDGVRNDALQSMALHPDLDQRSLTHSHTVHYSIITYWLYETCIGPCFFFP